MSLKEIYQRFRAWQIEPYQYKCESVNRHKCFNCGNSFEGDYCYVCGQKYKKGPMGWTPDEKHPKPLWGLLEPGTIVSYFLQLLGRPGYMIGDHLDGRKQMTGSPFKLMCYCAIAALFVLSITGNNISYVMDINETCRIQKTSIINSIKIKNSFPIISIPYFYIIILP